MKARLDDPRRLARLRMALTAAGWALGLLAYLALTDTPGKVDALSTGIGLLGCALALAAPLVTELRLLPRQRRLTIGPGRIELGRTVLARAELASAVLLPLPAAKPGEPSTLAVVRRPGWLGGLASPASERPVFVTFTRDEDREAAGRELGIAARTRGWGDVRLTVGEETGRFVVLLLRACVAAFLMAVSFSEEAPLVLVWALWPLVPAFLLLSLVLEWSGGVLEIGAKGVVHRSFWRRELVAYDAIDSVDEVRPDPRMVLRVWRKDGAPPLALSFGLRDRERSLAAAALRGRLAAEAEAARRADTAVDRADPRWQELRRRESEGGVESVSGWVARLDQLAAAGEASGYRSGALEPHALWSALADPGLDVETRCASARLLAGRSSTAAIVEHAEPALRSPVALLLEPSPAPAAVERALAQTEDDDETAAVNARAQRW